MRALLAVLILAAGAALAQLGGNNVTNQWTFTTASPNGNTCNQGQAWVLMPGGTLYTCQNGTVAAVSGGSGGATSCTGTSGQILTANGTSSNCAGVTTGTGVLTALGVNTGSAGAFVVNGGALGTPSGGTASNLTGLPISTGVSGLGTGIATALAVNTGSAGAPVLFNGAGGTPSSLVCTNCTGYPAAALPTITLTGDTTGAASGGSVATTTAKINGTAFAGTNGDVVSFGAANIPADSGFLATDVARLSTNQSFSGVKTFPGGDLFQGGIDGQVGTSYTVVAADENKLLTFNNGAAVAVTLPQATTAGFTAGAVFYVFNRGAGAVTITPTTSTINGGATVTLNQNQGAFIESDGTNYSAWVSSAPSGSGTVTSATVAGTANQVTASGTCTITTSGTCTLSLPAAITLGTDNTTAGTLQLANGAAAAHTIWSSGATTTNTIAGFAAVPTTGHIVDCTVASTTCTLHDSGVVTANVVNASSPGAGIAHFAGSTQTVTSSAVVSADLNITTTTCTAPAVLTALSAAAAGTCATPVLTQNSQSAAYTTVLGDAGKMIYHPGADTTARTWTIDSNANVAYPIGTCISFFNDTSAGVVTIAITSDTMVLAGAGTTGSRTLAASGEATACKMTTTRWMIAGNGLT